MIWVIENIVRGSGVGHYFTRTLRFFQILAGRKSSCENICYL